MMWRPKENAWRYAAKSVKTYLKSLKTHEIKERKIVLHIRLKYISFVNTSYSKPLVKILHLVFTHWNIFLSYMQNNQYPLYIPDTALQGFTHTRNSNIYLTYTQTCLIYLLCITKPPCITEKSSWKIKFLQNI
jgi:hypothetical protein